MRTVLVGLALLAVACTEHGQGGNACMFRGESHAVGSQFPAGDGCNLCTCEAGGEVSCTGLACPPPPDAAHVCTPGGTCTDGAECSFECCRTGEFCNIPPGAEAGTCSCNGGGPCAAGDVCASFGPVGPNGCGQICCGVSQPCPQ